MAPCKVGRRTAVVAFGTRPEAVKLAPVVAALRRRAVEVLVVVTAQHRALLEDAMRPLGLIADYDLDVMRPRQQLTDLTARVLGAFQPVLEQLRPGVVIVQGDTTSTFACALAAVYDGVPVAHVEAGLRSGDALNPFPEEINRRLAAVLARWHFAPTCTARENLIREGVAASAIHVTGNTVVDALDAVVGSAAFKRTPVPAAVAPGRRSILVTLHRRESWGATLDGICAALADIVDSWPDLEIVFPLHLNPAVRASVEPRLRGRERIKLIEPLEYTAFLRQMHDSWLVVTDSGGVQEEAPALGKPVLVLRNVTERMEAVDAGVARLIGTAPEAIREAITSLLSDPAAYEQMAKPLRPFGDGRAAERIAAVLNLAL